MPNDIKPILKKYGIFFGVMFGMTALVLCFILLARSSWRHGLAQTVQEALNISYPDSYVVGDFKEISSSLATSSAVFAVKPKKANTTELSAYAILVRMPTIAGAEPALFLYSSRYGAQFVGYALDTGKAADVLNTDVQKSAIAYWQKQIPIILEKAGVR